MKFQSTKSPSYKYTSRPNTNIVKTEKIVNEEYYGMKTKQE